MRQSIEKVMMSQILYDYAANRGEFTLFDFGDGRTEVPMRQDGLWLTRTVVFPILRGIDKPRYDGPLPGKEGEVIAMGSGWFVTAVEIDYICAPEDLNKKLQQAEELLLRTRDGKSASAHA
jgi:hypothetical protein